MNSSTLTRLTSMSMSTTRRLKTATSTGLYQEYFLLSVGRIQKAKLKTVWNITVQYIFA
jgi:hypothetical protein